MAANTWKGEKNKDRMKVNSSVQKGNPQGGQHKSTLNRIMEESGQEWKSSMNSAVPNHNKDPFSVQDKEEFKFKGVEGNRAYTEKRDIPKRSENAESPQSAPTSSGKANAGYSQTHTIKTTITEGNNAPSSFSSVRVDGAPSQKARVYDAAKTAQKNHSGIDTPLPGSTSPNVKVDGYSTNNVEVKDLNAPKVFVTDGGATPGTHNEPGKKVAVSTDNAASFKTVVTEDIKTTPVKASATENAGTPAQTKAVVKEGTPNTSSKVVVTEEGSSTPTKAHVRKEGAATIVDGKNTPININKTSPSVNNGGIPTNSQAHRNNYGAPTQKSTPVSGKALVINKEDVNSPKVVVTEKDSSFKTKAVATEEGSPVVTKAVATEDGSPVVTKVVATEDGSSYAGHKGHRHAQTDVTPNGERKYVTEPPKEYDFSGVKDGRVVVKKDGEAGLDVTQKVSATEAIEGTGTFNTMKAPDLRRPGQTAANIVDNQYKDSQTKQGVHQIQHIGALYGVGTLTSHVSKSNLEDVLYNRKNIDALQKQLSQGGIEYYGGSIRTGNVVEDYRHNVRVIERQLSDRNINAQNLNLVQINHALRTGKLEHLVGTSKGVTLDANTRALLTELKFLKEQEHRVKQYQQSKSGTMLKTWVKESVKDSDVYEGYSFAKKSEKVAKAGVKAGKVSVTGAAKAGINVVAGTQKLALNAKMLSNKIKLGNGAAAANSQIVNKINVINKKADKAKISITNTINPKLGTKAKNVVRGGANKAIQRFMPWMRPFQNRLAGSKILKVIKSPFSLVNAITRFVKKYVFLVLGGLVLLLLILTVIASALVSLFPSSVEYERDKSETVEDSNAQKMMNYVYSFQEAYTENLFQAKAGSIYAEKSIPDRWKDMILAVDNTLGDEENNTSVYDEGQFVGFNFNKYWGQRAWTTGGGEDAVGEKPIYHASISETWQVGGDDENPIYETNTVDLEFYGNAGLSGDIGSYSMSSPRDYYDWDGKDNTTLTFNINGGTENPGTHSDAYDEWLLKYNPDVECTFNYMGSRYTFTVTPDRYTKYYDRGGHGLHDYNIEEFYRTMLTLALGFDDNDEENADFYTLYCKELFDGIIDRSEVSMYYTYEKVTEPEVITINMNVNGHDEPVELHSDEYYKCNVHVDVFINDCGLIDMMYVDSILSAEEPDGITWSHNGDLGNEWAHSGHTFVDVEDETYDTRYGVRSSTIYRELDESEDDYSTWYTKQMGENVNPLWGMRTEEKNGTMELTKRTYAADGLERTYTKAMESCIEYYDLTVKDWENLVEGLMFPVGWEGRLTDGEIMNMLQMADENGYNPEDFEAYDDFLQYVLSTVGKYSYKFGEGHGNLDYRTYARQSIDCSGYISLLMQAAGKLPTGTSLTTVGLQSYFGRSSYNGNTSSLSVGDLVFKNGSASNADTNTYNHVAMFVGYLQLEGDSSPQPYFVESTSGKGSKLSPASRFSGYQYVSHTGV